MPTYSNLPKHPPLTSGARRRTRFRCHVTNIHAVYCAYPFARVREAIQNDNLVNKGDIEGWDGDRKRTLSTWAPGYKCQWRRSLVKRTKVSGVAAAARGLSAKGQKVEGAVEKKTRRAMAGRSNGGSWRVHRLFAPGEESRVGDDFDESDVWGLDPDPRLAESRKPAPPARAARKKPENCESNGAAAAAASLPVNVPDWSKILRQEYRGNARSLVEEEDEDAGTGPVIPPHEFLWRKRAASFSVHEGVGRTLKGRDLSRVRNAIWAQTGFED